MRYEAFDKRLKELGVRRGLGKRIWKQVAAEISETETVEAACFGVDKNSASKKPVVVTDRMVYVAALSNVFGGLDLATARRENVQSVDVSGTLLATMRITTSGGEFVIDKIDKPSAQAVARVLR